MPCNQCHATSAMQSAPCNQRHAISAMQAVQLVECGSLLGSASNKCFQLAVLRCFEGRMGCARSRLCMQLQRACANAAGTGFYGTAVERQNLEETVLALKGLRLGVWVVFARDAAVLRRGHALGKLYVGSPQPANVGAVAWFKQGHAVAMDSTPRLEWL